MTHNPSPLLTFDLPAAVNWPLIGRSVKTGVDEVEGGYGRSFCELRDAETRASLLALNHQA